MIRQTYLNSKMNPYEALEKEVRKAWLKGARRKQRWESGRDTASEWTQQSAETIYETTRPEERASQRHRSYPKGSLGAVSDGAHDQGIEPENSHVEAPTQSEMSKEKWLEGPSTQHDSDGTQQERAQRDNKPVVHGWGRKAEEEDAQRSRGMEAQLERTAQTLDGGKGSQSRKGYSAGAHRAMCAHRAKMAYKTPTRAQNKAWRGFITWEATINRWCCGCDVPCDGDRRTAVVSVVLTEWWSATRGVGVCWSLMEWELTNDKWNVTESL